MEIKWYENEMDMEGVDVEDFEEARRYMDLEYSGQKAKLIAKIQINPM